MIQNAEGRQAWCDLLQKRAFCVNIFRSVLLLVRRAISCHEAGMSAGPHSLHVLVRALVSIHRDADVFCLA